MQFFELTHILDVISIIDYPVSQLNVGIARHIFGKNHSSPASRVYFSALHCQCLKNMI